MGEFGNRLLFKQMKCGNDVQQVIVIAMH